MSGKLHRYAGVKMRLVMLPGLDGTGLLFKPLIGCLPERFTVDVISYPTDHVLAYDELVEFVRKRLPCRGDQVQR